MKRRIAFCIALASAMFLVMLATGCASDAAQATKVITDQVSGKDDPYAGAIEQAAKGEAFAGFESIGVNPSEYLKEMIKTMKVDAGDATVNESSAEVTLNVSHPDQDALIKLAGEKAKEFQSSDDYINLGKDVRFERSWEALKEAIAGTQSAKTPVTFKATKTDGKWSTDENAAEKVVGVLANPEKTTALLAAMKPYSWKYDDMNASQILETMKASGLPMGDIQVFDENTDPNKLLGRPGEYTSKAHFLDTRVNDEYGLAWMDDQIDLDYGGTVEVFNNASEAKKREEYIARVIEQGIAFGKTYTYRKDNVLFRVGFKLTPSEAADYEKEFYQRSE